MPRHHSWIVPYPGERQPCDHHDQWPKRCRQICTSLNSWTLQHIHRFFSTKGGRIKLSSGFQPSRWQNTHFELISIIVGKLPVFFLGVGEETVGIMGVISSKASPKKCFTSGHVRPSAVQKGKSELEKASDEIACSDVKVIRFFTFKTLPLDTFQPFLSFCHICFQLFSNHFNWQGRPGYGHLVLKIPKLQPNSEKMKGTEKSLKSWPNMAKEWAVRFGDHLNLQFTFNRKSLEIAFLDGILAMDQRCRCLECNYFPGYTFCRVPGMFIGTICPYKK